MLTAPDIEQLHAIADALLRKHDGDMERVLREFMHIAVDEDTRNIMPILASLEYAAREFFKASANEGVDQ